MVSTDIASPPRNAGRLFDVKLLIGVLVVAVLLVISLFTGVYDVTGAEDGAQMFQITRVPARSPSSWPAPRWPWRVW